MLGFALQGFYRFLIFGFRVWGFMVQGFKVSRLGFTAYSVQGRGCVRELCWVAWEERCLAER